MKIYAAKQYDDDYELLQSLIGQNLWIRAFVMFGSASVDCYVKLLGIKHGKVAIQAQEYNKVFDNNWFDGVYFVEIYHIEPVKPIQICSEDDIKDDLNSGR